ncbi:thermonuclease family protein [Candidatus Collierbacteria bacterium]|nr:thermonuclease family protein [Candidatus Collierbacteria bacterium]
MLKKKKKIKISREGLMKRKLPYAGVGFVMIMLALGINKFSDLNKIKDYQERLDATRWAAAAKEITDGDTFVLTNGVTVRLVGINAPEKGKTDGEEATVYLTKLIKDKRVYLEYDRYQDERFVRILAWVWVNCESEPKFLPYNYMHLTYNQSKPGLTENPEGCKKGQLVNEMMVKKGLAKTTFYKDRGEMKYEERLKKVF